MNIENVGRRTDDDERTPEHWFTITSTQVSLKAIHKLYNKNLEMLTDRQNEQAENSSPSSKNMFCRMYDEIRSQMAFKS